ncbi:MAG TPA: D-alanine--D-alanine ligase family protein [Acidimicrobiia bacterium]|jgi:D-alanine-D-alanine ligase
MLLFGGRSAEHDVSRVTAVAVARALDPARYEVVPVAITRDGRWLSADAARELIARDPSALPAALDVAGSQLEQLGGAVAGPGGDGLDVDVVFPLLHGPYGEDGTVQGLLELADLPYVGSGVLGSAVGMDKVMMKRAFAACGMPQGDYRALRDGEDRDAFAEQVVAELGLPCFVKPANMGSSVGVSKAHDRTELDAGIERALAFDEWVVAEEAVEGREIEVAVLGDLEPEASLPGEVVPGAEFYTYEDKYEDGAADLRIPAPLEGARTAEVRALALRAFAACRCEGMARVDFFFEESGRGFLVNEVNTIPGFTPISMYPKLWEVSGLPYPALLDRLVTLAIDRHARRAARAGRPRD